VVGPDPRWYRDVVRGRARGPGAAALRALLATASIPYGAGVRLNGLAYRLRVQKVHRAGCPVVSVGNITLGGTGKTPMVEWVARWYRGRGVRVALASRGYGATGGLNDEGMLLDQNLPDVPHLQGRDRVALARVAVEELESELIVLDDGFQHRRLARDLDLVLLDALDPFGGGRLFPAGLLREPLSALGRADVVVLSRADRVDAEARAEIRRRVERAAGRAVPWAEVAHRAIELVDAEGAPGPLEGLAGAPIAAFCGLGNPEAFRGTLEELGAEVVAFRAFPDHHAYTRADVDELIRWARACGARLVLTTQKDLVKVRLPGLGGVPLRAVRIGVAFLEGLGAVESRLAALVPPGTRVQEGTDSVDQPTDAPGAAPDA
jgi:tetraacyldisaccharide 4'-kinase